MKPKKNTNNGNLRPPGKMFGGGGRNGGQKYSHIRAYSDSDGSSSDDEYGGGNPNDDFIQREIRQQKLMMKKQDEGLEMLGQSAERLSQISMGIHDELRHQNKMLEEMEDDLDTATTNLSLVTLKTKELIQKSGGKRNFILIVLLTVVVVVLLFLVIYT
ncbi:hypothetical protein ACHAXA_005087 [Cyclostephanos tholiformis]|uniref:t-SNARE coiled-coil homology domain-containing protein n=1 Tax=Cyclostephanos tholiformis TaxID=382380 RepID=A0ABD3SSG9_9STRA